jgi:DNA replication protein DnaC
VAIIGPPGTGKNHVLIALGHAAVHAGHKVRYFTAADLVDTLYRGLADNTVGKIIDTLLHAELIIVDEIGFAPLDDSVAVVEAALQRAGRSLGTVRTRPRRAAGGNRVRRSMPTSA